MFHVEQIIPLITENQLLSINYGSATLTMTF